MIDNYLIKSGHEHHLMFVEAAYKGLVRPVLEYRKVQVGKDQEKAQSEKDSHSKNRGGKKPN